MTLRRLGYAAALAAWLGGAGCGREEIRTYRTSKEPDPAKRTMEQATEAGPGQARWRVPTGWKELPPGQMRVGHFALEGEQGQKAQVTIIPLANGGGGDLENVNRWRGQVSLSRISQEEMIKLAEPVKIAGAAGRLFDFTGIPPDQEAKTRLMVAILNRGTTAWFFKMMGDETLVGQQKATFVEFLQQVSFEAEAGPAAAAEPPGGGAGRMGAAPAAGGKPDWKVPAGWQEQPPGSMQTAKFLARGPVKEKAEITVSVLPGDAGGTLANVNRWRGQIGLPPVDEAGLASLTASLNIPGAKAMLVDITAEQTKRRLLAAVVARSGSTWFYKIMGDETVVAREKGAFVQFVQTAKYAP